MSKSSERIAQLLAGQEPIKWVFAGDSITHGALHTFGHRDYVEHFAERVRWEKQRWRDAIITTGVSGWRVTDILADLDWNILQYAPQVVSINIGMNDSTAGPEGVETFRQAYEEVLARLKKTGDPALILHTPNAIYQLPGDTRLTLPPYVQVIRELAEKHGAVLVDHMRDWQAKAKTKNLLYYLSDEIHPNDLGHLFMAHSLLRAVGLFADDSPTCRLFLP